MTTGVSGTAVTGPITQPLLKDSFFSPSSCCLIILFYFTCLFIERKAILLFTALSSPNLWSLRFYFVSFH